MSQRLTWGQVRDLIGAPIGLCGSNANLLPFANEASEALWSEGEWIGKHQRYKIRVTGDCRGNRCITWPSQIETIEAVSICNQPIGVRTQFFEFIENAVGQIDQQGCASLLGDRSETCVNHDIAGEAKRLKFYTQRTETGQTVRVLGYDADGKWIRTQVGGEWQDGEVISLASSPVVSTNYFSVGSPSGIQFSSSTRKGEVYLYSLDDDAVELQLATYQYNEKIPVFRRSILSGLPRYNSATDDEPRCRCVTVLARMRYQPFQNDSDYVQIGNVAALKAMIQYVWKRDSSKFDEAQFCRQEAIRLMNNELKQYNGYGAHKVFPFVNRELFAGARNLQ